MMICILTGPQFLPQSSFILSISLQPYLPTPSLGLFPKPCIEHISTPLRLFFWLLRPLFHPLDICILKTPSLLVIQQPGFSVYPFYGKHQNGHSLFSDSFRTCIVHIVPEKKNAHYNAENILRADSYFQTCHKHVRKYSGLRSFIPLKNYSLHTSDEISLRFERPNEIFRACMKTCQQQCFEHFSELAGGWCVDAA